MNKHKDIKLSDLKIPNIDDIDLSGFEEHDVELKVGELYYDSMNGLCMITDLYKADENKRGFNGCDIGRYERIRIPGRSFILYDKRSINLRLASDENIIEYLLDELSTFSLGNIYLDDSSILTISDEGIYISGKEEFLHLNKTQTRKLKELLNREIE